MIPSTRDQSLLGIYLNDHLAGVVVGANLARRLAASEREWTRVDVLDRLAIQLADDRTALLDMMAALDVPVRHHKSWVGWSPERVGRFKLNGRIFVRSPLSRVLELEAMRLGVEGNAAAWRTLRTRATTDDRLDADRLDKLIERAGFQIDQLEELRIEAATEVFCGRPDQTDVEQSPPTRRAARSRRRGRTTPSSDVRRHP